MSDKTRLEFEYWASDDGEYPAAVERDGHGYKLAQIQTYWQAWQAAKEKYEPRWIPVSERLPEPFTHVGLLDMRGFQNCPEQMQGADHIKDIGYYSLSPSLDQGTWSIRGERSVLVDAYTHWMKLPPAPSTQGGGE